MRYGTKFEGFDAQSAYKAAGVLLLSLSASTAAPLCVTTEALNSDAQANHENTCILKLYKVCRGSRDYEWKKVKHVI